MSGPSVDITRKIRGALRIPSAGEWFCLVAGLALVFRYFWFMDDAFVYLRYVDNWVLLGRGLVFNQGEYVEGYSSPLWTIVLGPLRWLGLSYPMIIGSLALLSFVTFWGLVVALNRRLAPGLSAINLPLAYLVFCYGVLCYFSSGLETPLIQVVAVAYALFILNPASIALQILLGLSVLLRPELLLPLVICGLWAWVRNRKMPGPMIISTVVSSGSWLVFRIWYYADLLPNTFYLKDTTDIQQGLRYLWDTLGPYHFHVLAAVILMAVLGLKYWRGGTGGLRLTERGVMLIVALSVVVYVTRIGGDPRHYRYLAFPFCLIACAFGGVLEQVLHRLNLDRYRWAAPVITLIIAAVSFSQYPRQLDRHPWGLDARSNVVDKINDAQWHRDYPALDYAAWGPLTRASKLRAFRRANPEFQYAKIGCRALCISAYVTMNEITIQSFGLTDAILARSNVEAERPAHKPGLKPMSYDLARITMAAGANRSQGMFRRAVDQGETPGWIRGNLEAIESIERKIYNRHHFMDNLRIALKPVSRIEP